MPLSALLLLVLSALLHAAYYGFYKQSADKQVFAWWFLLVAVILYSPILVLAHMHRSCQKSKRMLLYIHKCPFRDQLTLGIGRSQEAT